MHTLSSRREYVEEKGQCEGWGGKKEGPGQHRDASSRRDPSRPRGIDILHTTTQGIGNCKTFQKARKVRNASGTGAFSPPAAPVARWPDVVVGVSGGRARAVDGLPDAIDLRGVPA